ncbi:MAG: FimV/HubP family polar landmark protein [Paralcaligenes sp.]
MPTCHSSAASTLWLRAKPWVAALPVVMLMGSNSYAAALGHSRIVSEPGQALRMDVPIYELSADDLRSFTVSVAPAAAWTQAGLTPPVALSSLQLKVVHGTVVGSRVVRFSSSQPFNGPVADLLLEVHTATGQQQYQISVLATSPHRIAVGGAEGHSDAANAATGARQANIGHRSLVRLHVRRGDTLFGIARNHAVKGVSVYQLMVALQRANPQAFINQNMNLVKAGATLQVPDMASLTAISDREARRIFQKQALAFAQYRQRLAGEKSVPLRGGPANKGTVAPETAAPPPSAAARPGDQVRLSSDGTSAADARADNRVATSKGIADSQQRVSQLEENVQHINQALQGQGEVAKDVVIGAAKGLGKAIADAAGVVAGATGGSTGSSNGNRATSAMAQTGGLSGGQASPGVAGKASGSAANGGQPSGVSQAAIVASGSSGAPLSGSESVAAGSSSSGTGASASNGASLTSGGKSAVSATGTESSPVAPTKGAATGNTAAGNTATGNIAIAETSTANGAAGNTVSHVAGSVAAGKTVESSVAAGNSAAGRSTSENSGTDNVSAGSNAATGVAAGSSAAASAASGSNAAGNGATGAAAATGNTAKAADSVAGVGNQTSNKAGQSVSWFQEHLLGVITALLALFVLVIAWLLRRANIARDDDSDDRASTITEAMVKEKLDQVNLDLNQPPSDEPPASKS